MPVISFMQESKQIDDFTASILAGSFFTCCLFRYMKLFLNGCPQCRRDYKTDLQKILVIGVIEYKYHISKDQNNVITLFSSFSFLPMALTLRSQLHDLCSKGAKSCFSLFPAFLPQDSLLLHPCTKYFSILFSIQL